MRRTYLSSLSYEVGEEVAFILSSHARCVAGFPTSFGGCSPWNAPVKKLRPPTNFRVTR